MPGLFDNMYDQSFWGSYQDAARRRRALPTEEEIAANDNDSWYGFDRDAADNALRAQQGQAVAGGIITGLTGATSLLTNAMQSAQIRDTSMQEGVISDLSRAGNYNYQNYDQLANDYAQTGFSPNFGYQDIRGMTKGQQVGSVATSALNGATTGMQIGGPWGALIGGVVGLGTGLGGVLTGNSLAHAKQDSLNIQAGLAADAARQNFAAAHERIGDNMHRQQAANVVRDGGRVQTIKEYADKKLSSRPQMRMRHDNSKVTRIKSEGGVTYRIKK